MFRSAANVVITPTFVLSQVDDKDAEIRELRSSVANLKDQNEQAQAKVRAVIFCNILFSLGT